MTTPPWNMVLLRHDLPDGTWHYDWMLDLATVTAGAAAEPGLVTFRLWDRPEAANRGDRIRVEQLGMHRREYLTYEGEISGGRGRVIRLNSGRSRLLGESARGMAFEAGFAGARAVRWVARAEDDGWLIRDDG